MVKSMFEICVENVLEIFVLKLKLKFAFSNCFRNLCVSTICTSRNSQKSNVDLQKDATANSLKNVHIIRNILHTLPGVLTLLDRMHRPTIERVKLSPDHNVFDHRSRETNEIGLQGSQERSC